MHSTKNPRWFSLAAIAFAASLARAEIITPGSIPNPPSAVASANGTAVYASNLVSNQYMGLGLGFGNSGTAITRLNGVAVWAPVTPVAVPALRVAGGPPVNFPVGSINYYSARFGASLNSPSTQNSITASSLTVETIGHPGFFSLHVYGRNGLPLNITPVVQNVPGTNDEKLWKFTGAGISSFSAAVVPPPGVAPPVLAINAPWGVAAVSFTPSTGQTPEPSSLVLAGLGALGLAARFGWRRTRGEIV